MRCACKRGKSEVLEASIEVARTWWHAEFDRSQTSR